MAETVSNAPIFPLLLRDGDVVEWHHYCQHDSPNRLIQIDHMREAPPAPGMVQEGG